MFRRLATYALMALMLLGLSAIMPTALAAEDTASGSAAVGNVAPVAGLLFLEETGGTPVTDINPDVYYNFTITVTDNNSLEDIDHIYLYVYYPSTNEGGADNEENHYTFTYTEPNTWQENNMTGHINTGQCVKPSDLTVQTDNYTFQIKVGTEATPTNVDNWRAKFYVYDKDSPANSNDNTLSFDVNEYIQIVLDDTTLTFSGDPNDSDVTPSEQPTVATITSNVNYDVDAKLSDTWIGTTYSKTIPTTNTQAAQDAGHTGEVNLTTSYQTVWNNVAYTVTTKDIYWFLDIPVPLRADDYTVTFSVQAIKA